MINNNYRYFRRLNNKRVHLLEIPVKIPEKINFINLPVV
jgi:hypothetical protein